MDSEIGEGKVADPIEEAAKKLENGDLYGALVNWWQVPDDARQKVLRDTVRAGLRHNSALRYVREETAVPSERFIFGYFPLVTSDIVGRIVLGDESLTERDLDELGSMEDVQRSVNMFRDIQEEIGIKDYYPYAVDEDDFISSGDLIRQRFSLEDTRQLLRGLKPVLMGGRYYQNFGHFEASLFDITKHTDLLLDSELGPYLEGRR